MSSVQAAGPFLIGALLLLAGSLVGKSASRVVIAQKYKPAYEQVPEEERPLNIAPATVRNMLDWSIDSAQLLGVVVAPAVGLVFFSDKINAAVTLLYTVVMIIGFAATFGFVNRVNPLNYGQKRFGLMIGGRTRGIKKWKGLTPITIIGVSINLLAAGVAVVLTCT